MNVALIRESFAAIKPHLVVVMDHFLVEWAGRQPKLNASIDSIGEGRFRMTLANAFAHIVEYIEETDHLDDYLRKIGIRQQSLGVGTEDYAAAVEAFFSTCEYFFESQWTPEVN